MMRPARYLILAYVSIFNSRSSEELPTKSFVGNLAGRPSQGYFITVFIGIPEQKINVLVDTGSSNFAVAGYSDSIVVSSFNYTMSTSFINSNMSVEVPYTQGVWRGFLGSDIIRIPAKYNLENHFVSIETRVSISIIESSENFFMKNSPWQGILGLAYPRLSKPNADILPLFDQIVLDGLSPNIFSFQLCSITAMLLNDSEMEDDQVVNSPKSDGSLVFGEPVANFYDGILLFTPIIRSWYFEVMITDIRVSGKSLALNCKTYNYDRTIVDTGTTNFRVNNKVFDSMINMMNENTRIFVPKAFWLGQQVICWSLGSVPFRYFPNITLSLLSSISSNLQFNLLITPQLYLRSVEETQSEILKKNQSIAEDQSWNEKQKCYRFSISKSEKGTVIGAVILEGFYVVFDRENFQIGFATSTCGAKGRLNARTDVFGPEKRENPLHECLSDSTAQREKIGHITSLVVSMYTFSLSFTMPLVLKMVCTIFEPYFCKNSSNE